MKIGNLEINKCNECPAFDWAGENITQGNMGWRCDFGTFKRLYDYKNVKIPNNCPLRQIKGN